MEGFQGGDQDSVCSYDNIDQFTSTTIDQTLRFNDIITADVHLSLYLYNESTNIYEIHHLTLHSEVLFRRSQYFSDLLWQRRRRRDDSNSSRRERKRKYFTLTYKVPSSSSSSMKSIDTHLTVLELLYSTDDVNFSKTINTVSSALSILPVAKELLFEDCVRACVRLIEALPWTKEEEKRVLDLIHLHLLEEEESHELLSRLKMDSFDGKKKMLCGLIHQLRFHSHHRDFVAKMLREFSSKGSVKFALYHEFEMSFKGLNEQVSKTVVCSSESWKVMSYGDHLLWLIGMMIELRIADTALDRWIDQEGCSLTKNVQKLCSTTDKRIPPEHLIDVFTDVFTCTMELANAVATGLIVANTRVRMKLVKAWLPVALCFKDMILRFMPDQLLGGYKCEEPLFKILSTLPMTESQEVLLQCIGVGNPDYCCPHLEPAYETWFRRAANRYNS